MQSSDPLDLGVFYRKHHGWLYGWLRKKLGCAHHAADLAHDTFLRVMGSRDLGSLDEPRAYLTTTAQRLIIDQARRKRIEQAYLAELALRAEDIDLAPSPEQIVLAVEALMRLSAALEGLAAKPRQAFLLRYLDERSNAEIAEELSVSVRMVHKYLVGALVHCHGALES